MSSLAEFKKLKRRYYVNVFVETGSILFFSLTFFGQGNTNNLIFWAVIFFSSRQETERIYKKIMEFEL